MKARPDKKLADSNKSKSFLRFHKFFFQISMENNIRNPSDIEIHLCDEFVMVRI